MTPLVLLSTMLVVLTLVLLSRFLTVITLLTPVVGFLLRLWARAPRAVLPASQDGTSSS